MKIGHELGLLEEEKAIALLIDRLSENHSQRPFLEAQLHRISAGMRGEQRMKKKFEEFYSNETFHVLWNVRLQLNNWKVQMDGLLLTESGALILESKNISGKIYFDPATEEFYRINNNEEKTVMENPVVQLEKHKRFLRIYLDLLGIDLPVNGLIVFTSKKCEIMNKPPNTAICKTYQMNNYLYQILQTFPQKYAPALLKDVKFKIEENQIQYRQQPLCELYHIPYEDLETGISCQMCNNRSMRRVRKSWNCIFCGYRDPKAHILAINEYFSLMGPSVDNRTFRNFCQIESIFVASRLLASMDLERIGPPKKRVYRLKEA